MAVVRFSKELQEAILTKAKEKMAPGVARASQSAPDSEWGMRIYNALFGDLQPTLAKLPKGWVSYTDELTIDTVGDVACHYVYKLNPKVPWPESFAENELARKTYSHREGLVLKKHEVWAEYYAEVKAHRERVQAAVARQNEFVQMVGTVIKTYATLAPALKAWPPLWELVPEETRNKHREIVERAASGKRGERPAPNVDLEKLTAFAAAAKIGV
jgi:hypothetical protein